MSTESEPVAKRAGFFLYFIFLSNARRPRAQKGTAFYIEAPERANKAHRR